MQTKARHCDDKLSVTKTINKTHVAKRTGDSDKIVLGQKFTNKTFQT